MSLQQEEEQEEEVKPIWNSRTFALYAKSKIPKEKEYEKLHKLIDTFLEDCVFWAPELLTDTYTFIIITSILNEHLQYKLYPVKEEWIKELLDNYNENLKEFVNIHNQENHSG